LPIYSILSSIDSKSHPYEKENIVTKEVFVARDSDLQVLKDAWQSANGGTPKTFLLAAPYGGGKRALVAQLARFAKTQEEDVLIFRPTFSEEEDGQNTLVKLYAGLMSYLHGNIPQRGKVELALNSRKTQQDPRVQNWVTSFLDGMKKGSPKPGETQFQLHIPSDNPLLGFVELVHQMAQAYPVVLEIQNIHNTHSVAIVSMLKALLHKNSGAENCRLLTILSTVPVEENSGWLSQPLQDVLKEESNNYEVLSLDPWGVEETTQYLKSKELNTDNAEDITRLTDGRPGFVAELSDLLAEDDGLAKKLSGDLKDLYSIAPDADELDSEEEEDDGTESKRAKATIEDANKISFISALLGMSFPSGIVADMLNLERSSVDDIYDATEDIYKEVQFSKPLNTWIYQYKHAMIRECVLANFTSEDDTRIAGNTAAFVERFLAPAGYGYVVKALKIYAQAGVQQRADVMRNVALGADQPQMWNLTRDMVSYFDDAVWSDALIRTTYLNLCERMSRMGDVNQAEDIIKEALNWGAGRDEDDKGLKAFLMLSGSRLDSRRQDHYRARERAAESLELYRELESPVQQAEALAQLALVEFNDGKPNAALDRVNQAEELTEVVPLRALTSFIRGLVAKQNKQIQEALGHFTKANQLAGQAGRGALALDSGIQMGEMLVASGQHTQAVEVLRQVQQIAQGLKAGPQERQICAMMVQAFANQQQFEPALNIAQRALQISHALKDRRTLPADLYNVGFFQLMLKRPSEAVALLKQARELADQKNRAFVREVLFHLGQAQLQIGERSAAEESLQAALQPVQETRDGGKALTIYQQLGRLAQDREDNPRAEKLYNNALNVAKQLKNKEAQKVIKEMLKNMRG
jgi:tetratricopeptide (TPR) repeat protein